MAAAGGVGPDPMRGLLLLTTIRRNSGGVERSRRAEVEFEQLLLFSGDSPLLVGNKGGLEDAGCIS